MFSERVAKLDEMISAGEAAAPLYNSLPELICRLESLQGLHVQAGQFSNSLLQLDALQSQLSVQMANNHTILQQTKKKFEQNLENINKNFESLFQFHKFFLQDICLFPSLTISETFYYYGRIYSMSSAEIKSQIDYLTTFLDLQTMKNRCVRNMSGGQKRRVSLAMALVHSPDLLILDEPTVGVDPLLRRSIWELLMSLSRDHKKTIGKKLRIEI